MTYYYSPESMGMVAGLIYLVTMFLFIPFPFMKWFKASNNGDPQEIKVLTFPYIKVTDVLQRKIRSDLSKNWSWIGDGS